MKFSRTLLIAPLFVALLAGPVHARKGADDGSSHHDDPYHDMFDDDSHRGERREAFCKDNPATCEQMKINREALKKQCEANPAHCEALKAERQKRREKRQERRDDRREGRRDS